MVIRKKWIGRLDSNASSNMHRSKDADRHATKITEIIASEKRQLFGTEYRDLWVAWQLQLAISAQFSFQSQNSKGGNMLHLIWYIIVGFIAGCVAKALMGIHLKIM
jgi:hypothetical protein